MTEHLVIGVFALLLAAGMIIVGRPNQRGESPRFLRSYAAPMFYVPAVLAVFALAVAELIVWAIGLK